MTSKLVFQYTIIYSVTYSNVMGKDCKKESESDGNAPKTMIWKTVQRRAQRNSSIPATSSSCHHHGQ